MIWLRLKLDLLPCIAQEVERISAEYMDMAAQVRGGDKIAYRNLVLLQANIRTRIEEFEKFYDKFYADYRIGYFEKLKLRLRKLLSPHIDVNKAIYQQTQGIRRNELNQRRATSKDHKESLSPFRNAEDGFLQKPVLQGQGKLGNGGSSIQQDNLLALQNQAKQLFQRKAGVLQSPGGGYGNNSTQDGASEISNYAQKSPFKMNDTSNFENKLQQPKSSISSNRQIPGSNNNKGNTNASRSKSPISRQQQPQQQQQQQQQQQLKVQQNLNGQNQNTSKLTSSTNLPATRKSLIGGQNGSKPTGDSNINNNQAVQQPGETKSSVDEIVFTIRMTKEEYLSYLQAKSLKEK